MACPACGADILDTQTKHFDNALQYYRIGDLVTGSEVLTGVLEERLFCPSCHDAEQRIYVTIWHSLLTGIYRDRDEAERRLFLVDRADILNHLLRHQRAERKSNRRYRGLHRLISVYSEYCAADNKEKYFEGFAGISRHGLKSHLEASDPLASILEEYEPEEEDDGLF